MKWYSHLMNEQEAQLQVTVLINNDYLQNKGSHKLSYAVTSACDHKTLVALDCLTLEAVNLNSSVY